MGTRHVIYFGHALLVDHGCTVRHACCCAPPAHPAGTYGCSCGSLVGLSSSSSRVLVPSTGGSFRLIQQRNVGPAVLVNTDYYTLGGPMIVNINGEGPANGLFSVIGISAEAANATGALVLSLEHRYYGKSVVTPNLSVDNLKYLTEEQALADVANAITQLRVDFGVAGKTMVVGGSYSGALSSWARLKYPEVIAGALSFSSPVLAANNFYAYDMTTKIALGSECAAAMDKVSDAINSAWSSSEGRDGLQKMFNICHPMDQDATTKALFGFAIVGGVEEVVQYDNPPSLPLKPFCQMVLEGDTPIEGYAKAYLTYGGVGNQCTEIDFMTSLASTKVDTSAIGGRMWMWQKFTAFGFYKPLDHKSS